MKRRTEVSVDAAAKLNSSLQLEAIGFLEIGAKVLKAVQAANWCFSTTFKDVWWTRQSDAVVAVYAVQLLIQNKAEEALENIGIIRVGVKADYSVLVKLDKDNEKCIPDFLGIVGWMHVWPYVRAEVQQLSTKLGYPPLTIPLLIPGQTSDIPVVEGEAEADDNPPDSLASS